MTTACPTRVVLQTRPFCTSCMLSLWTRVTIVSLNSEVCGREGCREKMCEREGCREKVCEREGCREVCGREGYREVCGREGPSVGFI